VNPFWQDDTVVSAIGALLYGIGAGWVWGKVEWKLYRTKRQKEREQAILASTAYIYRSAPPMREKS
jgi:hypothetical protein